MTDNDVIKVFLENIKLGLTSEPYIFAPYFFDDSLIIQQANQPKQQGVNSERAIYFNKLFSHPYGFPGRNDVWSEAEQRMEHIETHWYESSYQFMALSIQDPSNVDSITAHDMLVAVKQVLYSDRMRLKLSEAEIGNYLISNIREPYFLDDYDRFESAPSFDITFTYKNIVTTASNVVESIKIGAYPVH